MVIGNDPPGGSDLGGRFTGIERSGPAEPSTRHGTGDEFSAHDTVLDRDVRVVVRAPASSASRDAACLARERALAALDLAALPGPLALVDHHDAVYVVFPAARAEPQATLADRLRGGPMPPAAAARLVADLAAAVATAHRSGVTLGGLRADRVVLTDGLTGRITAADPPGATIEQDVAGLGAVLYAALTANDPVTVDESGSSSDRPPAAHPGRRYPAVALGRRGAVVETRIRAPRQLRAGIPLGLSTLTMRALQADTGGGGIRSATTLASMLEEWATPAGQAGTADVLAGSGRGDSTRSDSSSAASTDATSADAGRSGAARQVAGTNPGPRERPSVAAEIAPAARRRRGNRLAWTAAVAVVLGLAGIGLIALLISRLVTAVPKQASPRPAAEPVITSSAHPPARRSASPSPTKSRPSPTASTHGTAASTRASASRPPGTAITPVSVSGFDPYYRPPGAENPDQAGLAADNNPRTAWYTLDYRKSPTFGNLKPGSGLRFDLGTSDTLSNITVTTPTAGINFTLLAAGTPAPQPSGYRTVGSVKDAAPRVTVQLPAKTRARYVVVWLTALVPHGGGSYRGGITQVSFRGRRQ